MKFGSLMFVMVLATLLTAAKPAISVGVQQVNVPDPAGKPLAVAIWYPSDSPAVDSPLGMFVQSVATDAPVSGKQLPLVLISHGTSGSLASHYDTALALAKAGFVVAALTHTGDNTGDQSYTGNRIDLIDRPRQSHVVLDICWTNGRITVRSILSASACLDFPSVDLLRWSKLGALPTSSERRSFVPSGPPPQSAIL